MSKMLIIGGSHSDLPLIESALMRGLKVYTTGNKPDQPGHSWSHEYLPADFSDIEAMLYLAKKIGTHYVLPGANDFAMISASYVAEKLRLPGYDSYDTTVLLHRKDRFKELATSIGMPVCRHVLLDSRDLNTSMDRIKTLQFPLMIKPVDLTGGKGISRIHSASELSAALYDAIALSRQTSIVAEEWFDGDLHSFSTVIENGEIAFDYCDTEFCLFKDYLVSTSMSLGNISRAAAEAVRSATRRLVRELGLGNGVLHSQILVRGDDIRILEYTRRMSGDLYSKVVQLVRGIRHADIFVDVAMGESVRAGLALKQPCNPYVVRHCVTAEQKGTFTSLHFDDRVRSYVHSVTLAIPFGAEVAGDGSSKVATVVLTFPSEEEMTGFIKNCRVTVKCGVHT